MALKLACVSLRVCLCVGCDPLVQIDFLSKMCLFLTKTLRAVLYCLFVVFVFSYMSHWHKWEKIIAGNYYNVYIYILFFFYICFAIFIFLYNKMLFCSIMVIMPVLNNAGIFTSVGKHYYYSFFVTLMDFDLYKVLTNVK